MKVSSLLSGIPLSVIALAAPLSAIKREAALSGNWAGLTLSGSNLSAATGTFTVPHVIKMPAGGNPDNEYSGAAWVGIDGFKCKESNGGGSILQTGIYWSFKKHDAKDLAVYAWFEWYPKPMVLWPSGEMSVHPGDLIKATVQATSLTSGIAIIENLTTKKTATHAFSGMKALCHETAECIVEKFDSEHDADNFADFGTLEFSNAYATLAIGHAPTVVDTQIWNIWRDNKPLTDCKILGPTNIACTYLK